MSVRVGRVPVPLAGFVALGATVYLLGFAAALALIDHFTGHVLVLAGA